MFTSFNLKSIYTLFGCLFDCPYPSHIKMTGTNGPTFCVGPPLTPRKVHGTSKLIPLNAPIRIENEPKFECN